MEHWISSEWDQRTVRGVGPHAHDQRAFAVAARVAALIAEALPGTTAEHVGSSAVLGLSGKGIVDLQISAVAADIPAISEALLALGFSRQTGADAFPPTRPMLRGTLRHEGAVFGLHCHVVPSDHPELGDMIRFRDLLRADTALCAEYAALKRAIVDGGVTDPIDYTEAKTAFIKAALSDRR